MFKSIGQYCKGTPSWLWKRVFEPQLHITKVLVGIGEQPTKHGPAHIACVKTASKYLRQTRKS